MATFEISGTVEEFIEAIEETTFTFLLPMASSTPRKEYPEPAPAGEILELDPEPGAERQERRPNIEDSENSEPEQIVEEVPVQGDGLYSCLQCDFTTVFKHNLTRHERAKHEMRRYVCGLCHKRYTTLHYLEYHIKETHQAEKNLLCEHCATPVASEGALAKHLRTAHGIGGFKCDSCPKSFKDAHTLTVHKRRHTGEKPFVCRICASTFVSQSSLNVHSQSCTQDGQKRGPRFQCSKCDKKFSLKITLSRHFDAHHTNIQHFCNCGKKFKYASSLARHKKQVCTWELRFGK